MGKLKGRIVQVDDKVGIVLEDEPVALKPGGNGARMHPEFTADGEPHPRAGQPLREEGKVRVHFFPAGAGELIAAKDCRVWTPPANGEKEGK